MSSMSNFSASGWSRFKPSLLSPSDQNPLGPLITRFVKHIPNMLIVVRATLITSGSHFLIIPTSARIIGREFLAIPTDALAWISEGYLAIRTRQPILSEGMAESEFAVWVNRTFSCNLVPIPNIAP